mmetsp:Transcript_28351/g.62302  ORF Transcript_28351/g.62302 Transcript_28351/m.62302 type:complete len:283 (+) Transcript_28351:407-1255(+)
MLVCSTPQKGGMVHWQPLPLCALSSPDNQPVCSPWRYRRWPVQLRTHGAEQRLVLVHLTLQLVVLVLEVLDLLKEGGVKRVELILEVMVFRLQVGHALAQCIKRPGSTRHARSLLLPLSQRLLQGPHLSLPLLQQGLQAGQLRPHCCLPACLSFLGCLELCAQLSVCGLQLRHHPRGCCALGLELVQLRPSSCRLPLGLLALGHLRHVLGVGDRGRGCLLQGQLEVGDSAHELGLTGCHAQGGLAASSPPPSPSVVVFGLCAKQLREACLEAGGLSLSGVTS